MDVFIIRPHSIIDIITNSSTEVFICDTKKTLVEVKELLQGLLLVYSRGVFDHEDWNGGLDFDTVFNVRVAGDNIEDTEYSWWEEEYKINYKKGDIIIESASDNSIPYPFFEMIEHIFEAERRHLG